MRKAWLVCIMFLFLGSSCFASGLAIGNRGLNSNNRLSIDQQAISGQNIESACTDQVKRTRGDNLVGLNCKLLNSDLIVNFMISNQGLVELQNDKEAQANLNELSAQIKKNTCLNPKTFSNGIINRVKYNYVDQHLATIFSFDVTKADCGMRAFRHN